MPLRSRGPVLAGVAAAALVALPGVAQAAGSTKSVDMGTPISAQKTLQKYGADVNDFFPHSISVHVGQKVRFVPTGFHTVDFVPRGGNGLDLLVPQTDVTGAKDAAGNPFWFSDIGQKNVGFNSTTAETPFAAIFDTTRSGNSNVGHATAEYLGDVDWAKDTKKTNDLLEFMKTL